MAWLIIGQIYSLFGPGFAEPLSNGTTYESRDIKEESSETERWRRTHSSGEMTLEIHAVRYGKFGEEKEQKWYTLDGKRITGEIRGNALDEFNSNPDLKPKASAVYVQILLSVSGLHDFPNVDVYGNKHEFQLGILEDCSDATKIAAIDDGHQPVLATYLFDVPVPAFEMTWVAKDLPLTRIFSGQADSCVDLVRKDTAEGALTLVTHLRTRSVDEKGKMSRDLSVILSHAHKDKDFFIGIAPARLLPKKITETERRLSIVETMMVGRRFQSRDRCVDEWHFYDVTAGDQQRIALYCREKVTYLFSNIPGTEAALQAQESR